MKKYMILLVAGQSNAVGYDESPVAEDHLAGFDTARLWQLGFYGQDNLRVIPLGVCAQNFQDLRPYSNPANRVPGLGTKGIHLPLAQLLLADIPEDYDILVLPCAYGGTGFTVGETGGYDAQAMRPAPGIWRWGPDSPYYLALKDRLAFALDLNPDNRFLGAIWVQGEQDSADAEGHRRGFAQMTEDFFAVFALRYPGRVWRGDWNRDIWYNVETTAYWYGVGQCGQIWENYRAWNPGSYVEIPRDTHTNAVRGSGLTAAVREAHFGDDAFVRVIAPRAAAAMSPRFKWQ